MIELDDFMRIDMRVGPIISADPFPEVCPEGKCCPYSEPMSRDAELSTSDSMVGPPPDGMPEPSLAPPQIARTGDPFASLRIVHFASRLRRNVTHQLRDVVVALNAAHLDWSFNEKVVLNVIVQLQANWSISFHGDDRIVLDRNERGHTLMIVDSSKMTPFMLAEVKRLVHACEEELREFALGDGRSTDY